jgi:DNA-binding SARP family transcriptional activator/tetratricopeptide (TPR) repeat protein
MAVEDAVSGDRGDGDVREPVLRVRLLGGLELRLGGDQVPPLDSARAESLLAYLLLHRDAPQQRQHLAFTLWPDSSEPQARTNLRHVLHNLRRALPDADRFIDVRPRTLQWRAEAPLLLDVAAFEQALADGRLEDAVHAYGGELLEGSYDDWLLEERERLGRLYADALELLAQRLEEQGRLSDAIRHAERLLRHDPLREESYRLLMRLHDARGDGARALRTYHACATTLVRELGVEPSADTRRAYEALLRVAAEEPPEGATAAPPTAPALVGRKAERARLAELWRAAEGGSAQFVLVSGEAGIGKSRLVEELRSWCAHRGAVTAEARAYAAEGAMAYGVLVAWLRADPIGARLRRLNKADLTELARLLPELISDSPGLAAPEPLPEDEQRQRLYEAAARALLAAGSPLMLVADDLQWFDMQTLQFMHYLLRTRPEARLLIAATARRQELDAHDPVSELIVALQELGRMLEIGLERLKREETALLAERISGAPLEQAEAARIYDESEGNPLFVIEALRAGGTAGAGKVQAVIRSRLAQLSDSAAELVGVAATIGREFTAEVLAGASEADAETLVRGLDELWRRGIVRAHGPSAYDFSHGKIRDVAYGALSPAQASNHHLRVAAALERGDRGHLDAVSGQIAAHHEAAGSADEAIAWYLRAAGAAQRLHASGEAVRSLERALGLVLQLPESSERDPLELRLLTKLPAPLLAVEGYFSARIAEVHERAIELAQALGVDLEPPLIRSLALASLARGEFQAGHEFGAQLRARGERERDEVLTVEGGYVLGIAAYWQGQLAPARAFFEDTIERCQPEQRAAHLASYGQDPEIVCLTRLAHTLWLLGKQHEAERTRDLGLELAAERGHPYSRAVATVFAGMLALDQRDEQRLRRHADELASADRAYEAPQIRIVADALGGLVEVLGGQADQAAGRVHSTVLDARRDEPATPGFHALLMRILLETLVAAGEPQSGLVAVDEALKMGGGAELWEAEIRRLRAGLLGALGAASHEVEAELSRAIEVAQRQGARAFELRARADLDRLGPGTS